MNLSEIKEMIIQYCSLCGSPSIKYKCCICNNVACSRCFPLYKFYCKKCENFHEGMCNECYRKVR